MARIACSFNQCQGFGYTDFVDMSGDRRAAACKCYRGQCHNKSGLAFLDDLKAFGRVAGVPVEQ